jgi:hypothetical protein
MDLRVWLVVFLILAPLTTPIVSAEASTPEIQTKDGDRDTTNEPSVFVTAEIEGDKWVDVGFDSSLEQKYDFPKIFSAVFGCSMGDVNLSRDEEDQLTSFHTNCKTTIQRSSMARSGTINLQPIRDIQSTDPNVNFASLSLWFPQSTSAAILLPSALLIVRTRQGACMLNSSLAVAVILLFGLSFPSLADSGESFTSADANAALGGLYVLIVVWLSRACVLAPY